MILVNLLPHREAARKRRREAFIATLGLAAIAGLLISGAVYSWYLTQIESQRGKNLFLTTENQSVQITGVAQSNERVSELLRNFSNNSPFLSKPELIEITAGSVALSPRDQRRIANFSVRVSLKRTSDPKAASSAASSALPASAVKPVAAASSAKA